MKLKTDDLVRYRLRAKTLSEQTKRASPPCRARRPFRCGIQINQRKPLPHLAQVCDNRFANIDTHVGRSVIRTPTGVEIQDDHWRTT